MIIKTDSKMFKDRNYLAFAIVNKSELLNAKITSQLLTQPFQKQQLFFIMEPKHSYSYYQKDV